MGGIVSLTVRERKGVLGEYRGSGSRRAHALLLLEAGRSYREIAAVLFGSFDFIAGVVRRYREGGVTAALGIEDDEPMIPDWLMRVAIWLGGRASPLAAVEFCWRRPRPVVRPGDPEYREKLWRIQHLLATSPPEEMAVFQDEVDVNLNPKIGSMWMRRGRQAEIITPGNNVKRHFVASLHWRTGRLILFPPTNRRNAAHKSWYNVFQACQRLMTFANTLEGCRSGFLAWYEHPNSTGLNNRFKTAKRTAYGYRNEDYFKLKLPAIHQTEYALVG